MEPFTLITLVALIYVAINFLKHVVNIKDPESKNAVVTQLIVWVGAVGILSLAAQADIASGLTILNSTLANLDFASLALIGLSFGSTGSVFFDFLKARDPNRSSATPSFLSTPGNEG